MGQAKVKQYNREQFLLLHPSCCYCGAVATTTDHCPPRGLFPGRIWPEGYEFPCCKPCNERDRFDEQIISVLLQPSVTSEIDNEAWAKTLRSIAINHPEYFAEWMGTSRNETRKSLREFFGEEDGDRRRRDGWGTWTLGTLSNKSLDNFMLKLGQALFYKHTEKICTGKIFAAQMGGPRIQNVYAEIISFFPISSSAARGKIKLSEAFSYDFNVSPTHGAFICLVRFREQFSSIIVGLDEPLASRFALGKELTGFVVRECGSVAPKDHP